MKHAFLSLQKTSARIPDLSKKIATGANSFSNKIDIKLIRFEERKEAYSWVRPEEILFVKSADHYVKSLIDCGKNKKWMIRHCTLKELSNALSSGDFVRLNKFYLLNLNHFSHINENEKLLYLNDNFSIPVPHRISRYVIDSLNK